MGCGVVVSERGHRQDADGARACCRSVAKWIPPPPPPPPLAPIDATHVFTVSVSGARLPKAANDICTDINKRTKAPTGGVTGALHLLGKNT